MNITILKFTVFFEKPFWVGVYEREYDGRYEVCKITFGAEPKDYEVYEFLLKNFSKLKFSSPTKVSTVSKKRINPKRMQRAIKNQLNETGVGTKAQQALKVQQQQGKLERKSRSREQKKLYKEMQYQLRQQKRKENHKGH